MDQRSKSARAVTLGLGVLAVLATACGGDDGDKSSEDVGFDIDRDEDALSNLGPEGSLSDVDTCSLLTDEDVSAWAGRDLAATGHSAVIGCVYNPPGEDEPPGEPPEGSPEAPAEAPEAPFGVFGVRVFAGEGDAATAGAALQQLASPTDPDSVAITEIPAADLDAVAVTPAEGHVYVVVARQDDLFVELYMSALRLTVDSPELGQLPDLAAVALGRLEEAAAD